MWSSVARSRLFLFLLSLAIILAFIAASGSPAGPTSAHAQAFVVDDASDADPTAPEDCTTLPAGDCSLRDAIAAANGNGVGDLITFAPGITAITLDPNKGQLIVESDGVLTIDGGDVGVTVSGETELDIDHRIFLVDNGANLRLENITVTGGFLSSGDSGGGIFVDGGTLTLVNSTVSGNIAAGGGGGIASSNSGIVNVTNSTVEGNSAQTGEASSSRTAH